MPPYMYPPPSTLCTEFQILLMYPLKKLLKFAWLLGNFPLTIAVSAINDFTELPALAMNWPKPDWVSRLTLAPTKLEYAAEFIHSWLFRLCHWASLVM